MPEAENPFKLTIASAKGLLIEQLATQKHGSVTAFLDANGLTTADNPFKRKNVLSAIRGSINMGDALFVDLLLLLEVDPRKIRLVVADES